MHISSHFFSAFALAGFISSLSACQPKPGEYRIYKITSLPPAPQADCQVEIDVRDMTTFFDAATIAIFATDTDDFFLEYGEDVVSGTRDGKTYSFEGMSVNVEDPVEGTTVTTTNQLTVELTINNREINGDVTTFTSSTCTGSCEAFEDTQCTVIGTFFGTEIKDVELEHAI